MSLRRLLDMRLWRGARAWLVYALCVAAAGSALAWVTVRALHLETSEKQARADAAFQESVRLALWRMDSTVAPILAVEASRPYFHYRSFYPAERAVTRLLEDIQPGEILVPSPLLEGSGRYIKLHFQIEAGGSVTSPQAPSGNLLDLAEGQHVAPAQIDVALDRLANLTTLVRGTDIDAAFDQGTLTLGVATHPNFSGNPNAAHKPLAGGSAEGASAQDTNTASPFSRVISKITDPDEANKAGAAPTGEMLHFLKTAPPQVSDEKLGDALEGDEDQALRQELASNVQRARSKKSDYRAPPKTETAPVHARTNGADPVASGQQRKSSESAEQAISRTFDSATSIVEEIAADAMLKGDAAPIRDAAKDTQGPLQLGRHSDLTQGPFAAQWRSGLPGTGPELLFVRDVTFGDRSLQQGFWLDWHDVETSLLASARTLLPECSLVPIYEASQREANQQQGRLLATVPVVFEPGSPPVATASFFSPTRLGLFVAWLSVSLAALGIGLVLRTSMELAERRGRFVSAVTHELRTPLTTFCLYTDLLAHGMVKDEDAKRRSLDTLHREAQRLSGIVENVLAYARLGQRTRTQSHARTPIVGAIQRALPTLHDAAARADMELVTTLPNDMDDIIVNTDETTIERICANLVDNACKYGKPAHDSELDSNDTASTPRIKLTLRAPTYSTIEISVRDFGAGVPAHEQARIFRPFEQVDRDGKAEGLGLGLALSRQLAQQAGGELVYETPEDSIGARFVLRLGVV